MPLVQFMSAIAVTAIAAVNIYIYINNTCHNAVC